MTLRVLHSECNLRTIMNTIMKFNQSVSAILQSHDPSNPHSPSSVDTACEYDLALA
ncbi:hypothetical protein RSAG8_09416, partial [Rhizoctonia solani AG-8 WAC10335]